MLLLLGCGLDMLLVVERFLLRRRPRPGPPAAAVKADATPILIFSDCFIVDVRNVDGSKIVHGPIVEESILISVARIAIATVDAAIEADAPRPVTSVKDVAAIDPVPIGWRPSQSGMRWLHPGTWHPIIVGDIFTPGPETGNLTFLGDDRLRVERQRRRRIVNLAAAKARRG